MASASKLCDNPAHLYPNEEGLNITHMVFVLFSGKLTCITIFYETHLIIRVNCSSTPFKVFSLLHILAI